jgi:hypothetical protein
LLGFGQRRRNGHQKRQPGQWHADREPTLALPLRPRVLATGG